MCKHPKSQGTYADEEEQETLNQLPPRTIIVGCDEQFETRLITDQKTLRLLFDIEQR